MDVTDAVFNIGPKKTTDVMIRIRGLTPYEAYVKVGEQFREAEKRRSLSVEDQPNDTLIEDLLSLIRDLNSRIIREQKQSGWGEPWFVACFKQEHLDRIDKILEVSPYRVSMNERNRVQK